MLPSAFMATSPTPYYEEMPVGSVIAFAGDLRSIKTSGAHATNFMLFNWLLCDGRSLKIVEYPELFLTLGELYGGDGRITFCLPDYEGTFLRGLDYKGRYKGSKEDRTAANGGSRTGVGSTQDFAMEKHTHTYQKAQPGTPIMGQGATATISQNIPKETSNASGQTGVETRPVNTFVHWLIKSRL